MADTKISALPSASTPLTGTEVLPIVQGAANFKVSIADVTAGRAVSALSFAGPLNGTVGATTPAAGSFTNITGSANAIISVTDNTNAALRITQLGTGDALLITDSGTPDATPFVVNNSGQVIVGDTSTYTSGGVTASLQVTGTTADTGAIAINSFRNSANGAFLSFAHSKSGVNGTQTTLVQNDAVGLIRFSGSDGTAFIQAAAIESFVDGTPGTNDMPGRLVFSTTADGASSPTERMRIDSTGDIGIGTTSPLVKLEIAGNNNTTWIVTASISGVTMDVTAVSSGTIAVGDLVYGANIQPYTRVTALGTGTGGVGTYTVSVYQTAASSATTYGTTQYGATLIRITDIDTNQAIGQPNGALQFFSSDASTPTAGVGAYVAALAESVTPDTALVFGTRDNAGGGIDANERMRIASNGDISIAGGTANGVAYLNGSKVLTSGTALTFDGTNFAATGLITGSNATTSFVTDAANGFALFSADPGSYNISRSSTTVSLKSGGPISLNAGSGSAIIFNNGSEAMRLTSTGLGIGTTSPAYKLDVTGSVRISSKLLLDTGTAALPSLTFSGWVDTGIYNPTGTSLGFSTNGAEKMRLDSAGNLGLGVTPSAWDAGGKAIELAAGSIFAFSSGAAGEMDYVYNTYYNAGWKYKASSSAASLYSIQAGVYKWFNAPSGTAGAAITFTQAMTLDASGRLLVGSTASFSAAAKLQVQDNISLDTNGTGGKLEIFKYGVSAGFFNTPATSGQLDLTATSILSFSTSGAERARLDASGNLLVGQTARSQTVVGAHIEGGGGTNPGTVSSILAASTNAASSYNLYSTGAGAFRFYVGMGGTIFATSIVITAISDERLKENIRDIDTGLDAIMALQPRRFNWKEGKGQDKKNAAGFIAQEFENVFPECVSTSKAGGDGIEYKNINHETLIPTLVKAIQEQQALIESLTQRLTALESK